MPAPVRHAALGAIAMLLSGCATLFPETCEQFEENRKTANYNTEYKFENARLDNAKPLGRNEMATAPRYQMRLDSENVRPCSHAKIKKQLTLVRRDNADLIFEETREFFTAGGKRIAQRTETLTTLDKSGRYTATVPLPIPKNAPAGKYHLTSILTVKTKHNPKPIVLARSTATFTVTAPKK
jgi:hypothetical protein